MTSALASQIQTDLLTLLERDELILPTLPEAAIRIREVAEDANTCINDLTVIIARDPALSARVIKVTNSPLIRVNDPVTDLTTAVSRLGIDFTSNLAIAMAIEQMFQATHDLVDQRMRECWSQSLEVSATAQVLARHFTQLKPDQAMLAGLVHKIGMLPILFYAEQYPSLLKDDDSFDKVSNELHPILGSHILNAWDFPQELRHIPKSYLDLKYSAPEADYCDLIQVAVLQSHAGTDHPLAKIDTSTLSSFQRLGLIADNEITRWEALSDDIDIAQTAIQP